MFVLLSSSMSETLTQRIKELEEELERLKSQVKERREAGEDISSPSLNEDTACKPDDTSSSNKRRKKTSKERPFDFSAHPRRHVALRLAYLGWAYQGFAVQENTDSTVEARLFEALLKTRLIQDRQSSNYHRCGRTDKGVSAFSQVSSLRWNLCFIKCSPNMRNGTYWRRSLLCYVWFQSCVFFLHLSLSIDTQIMSYRNAYFCHIIVN